MSDRREFFSLIGKVMFLSQDTSQVFVSLTIPWFMKSMMPWVLVDETGCTFEYIFWTTTH